MIKTLAKCLGSVLFRDFPGNADLDLLSMENEALYYEDIV